MSDTVAVAYRLAEEHALRVFCEGVLTAVGVATKDAAITSEVLVTADLRGIESHGTARLKPYYVDRIRAGTLDPHAKPETVRETDASVLVDAHNGLGHPAAKHAMDAVIAKAAKNGAAFGAVRNSNHFGIAGYYAMQALPHDMIGFASTNSVRFAAATFGKGPMLGTNPLAFAVPTFDEPPFVLDFATSTVTRGKLEVHARTGEPLSPGWAIDADGNETLDARAALKGALLPLGGLGVDQGGHKGYGLALMVDIFCGVMSGGMFGTGTPAPGETVKGGISHCFGAFRIDGFRDAETFKRDMDRELRDFKSSAKASGRDRIYVAGEIEHDAAIYNRANGVPLHPAVWAELEALGGELGVPFTLANA